MVLQETPQHVTRFIALADVGNTSKKKVLTPLNLSSFLKYNDRAVRPVRRQHQALKSLAAWLKWRYLSHLSNRYHLPVASEG